MPIHDGVVCYAKGALYGYCPKCGEPGERRWDGKDRCMRKHVYDSTLAKESATGENPESRDVKIDQNQRRANRKKSP